MRPYAPPTGAGSNVDDAGASETRDAGLNAEDSGASEARDAGADEDPDGGREGSDAGGWSRALQFGSVGDDVGYSLAVGADGNVFVAGVAQGDFDGTWNSGSLDAFVVKVNPSGAKEWTKQFGTNTDDWAKSVAVDAQGNVFVTGRTRGGLDGQTNEGGIDAFLVKLDAAGQRQWTRLYGAGIDEVGDGVAVDSQGGVYVTGWTHLSPHSSINCFLLKFDSASGNTIWTRSPGTDDLDACLDVAVDRTGNVFITGKTFGDIDGTHRYTGHSDVLLMKYDTEGQKLWAKQFGSTVDDEGSGIAIDTAGNVFLVGWTSGQIEANTNAGGDDLFVMKLNGDGAKVWARQLGTSRDEWATKIAIDSSGNAYVTGFCWGAFDGNTHAGGNDIILVKYDGDGTKQWSRQLGTAENETGTDVAVDATGNVYLTGVTMGEFDGNANAGRRDAFLVRFDANGVRK